MNLFKKIGKGFGQAVIWFDRFVNWTIGRLPSVWSDYGGRTGETISSTLGLEEAVRLWYLYQDMGDKVYGLTDIEIEDKHLLGEFSSDLCDVFQKYHALQSINWKKNKKIMVQYPGIKALTGKFLAAKGIKGEGNDSV